MTNLRNMACIAIVVAGLCSLSTAASAGGIQHKPLPPLQISIAPAKPGVTQETIKAGDVVDFNVSAISMVDATEMRIQVDLVDGAELVAGDLSWNGPAKKNEMKTLPVTIKAPLKGNGSVKAQLSITLSGGSVFTTSSEYALGGVKNLKPETSRPVRKDRKGKDVIEYR